MLTSFEAADVFAQQMHLRERQRALRQRILDALGNGPANVPWLADVLGIALFRLVHVIEDMEGERLVQSWHDVRGTVSLMLPLSQTGASRI